MPRRKKEGTVADSKASSVGREQLRNKARKKTTNKENMETASNADLSRDSPLLFQLDSPKKAKLERKGTRVDAFNSDSDLFGLDSPRCSPLTSAPLVKKKKKTTKVKPKRPAKQEKFLGKEVVPDFDSIEKFQLVVEPAGAVPDDSDSVVEKMTTSTPARFTRSQRSLNFTSSAISPMALASPFGRT